MALKPQRYGYNPNPNLDRRGIFSEILGMNDVKPSPNVILVPTPTAWEIYHFFLGMNMQCGLIPHLEP